MHKLRKYEFSHNKYFGQVCLIKMTEYWPNSLFFFFSCVYGPRTVQVRKYAGKHAKKESLVNKGFL